MFLSYYYFLLNNIGFYFFIFLTWLYCFFIKLLLFIVILLFLDFPLDTAITALIVFSNGGSKTLNISHCVSSLHSPFDLSYYVQNVIFYFNYLSFCLFYYLFIYLLMFLFLQFVNFKGKVRFLNVYFSLPLGSWL